MAYHIAWDNTDKTVVLQEYVPPASKQDLFHLARESSDMLKMVSHTVHIIVDERPIRLTLKSADLQILEDVLPPNQGAVVVVVAKTDLPYKGLVQQLGSIVAPKSVGHTHFASSLEEARMLLRETYSVRYP